MTEDEEGFYIGLREIHIDFYNKCKSIVERYAPIDELFLVTAATMELLDKKCEDLVKANDNINLIRDGIQIEAVHKETKEVKMLYTTALVIFKEKTFDDPSKFTKH